MNRIFLISCVFFALLTAANAGEMYSCIDHDGNKIITDSPKDGMNCVLKESYIDPSPEERAQEQKESERRSEQQEYQRAQRIQEEERREEKKRQQDVRNKEADKLEAEANKIIAGSHGMTAAQTAAKSCMLVNVARLRAGEAPIPCTPPTPPPIVNVPPPIVNVWH